MKQSFFSSRMGIFKTLAKNSKYKTNRTFLTSTTIISSTPFPSSPLSLSFCRPRLLPSFSCPLFLSSPPWKLSQSATPVHLQSDAVLFEKVKSFNLLRTRNFPIRLGILPTVSTNPTLLLNTVHFKDFRNDAADGSEGFRESFVNLPNLVSITRLVSGPILGLMILQGWYFPAFVGLAVSGATDWLDGYIARKMNIISVVGSYLDPLADKVLIGCVALAMAHDNLLHPGLVGLVVLRDVFLVGGAVYKRASNLNWKWKTWCDFFNLNGTSPQKVEPLFISKVNTVLQLALVAGALLQPDFGTEESQTYVTYLSWLVASTTVASTAAYGVQQLRIRSSSSIRNH